MLVSPGLNSRPGLLTQMSMEKNRAILAELMWIMLFLVALIAASIAV
jgi:hypothetical protein